MRLSVYLTTFILLVISPFAQASCWKKAEKSFGIEAKLLQAIAQVESGMKPNAVGRNNNGTHDVGLMQINSSHFPRLKKLGIDAKKMKEDPCISIMVGASILSDMMKVYGYSWEAVGAYNAGLHKSRRDLRMRYARKVWKTYSK
ncbi:type III secretion system invasion protein IagB [Candidatus Regiella insecticola]|uniref:Transglycosylase SLT domain-containing protein n=1 Tax=Candidatus Regiella insecticola TaxID=138073 RepID=A0A6L2ZQM7_9ENTR|nr:type III secretion system invasion protein IagB [Candidatus Regiella insecticola]GFN46685.1 transglycosylase SLT domain-containing protein [Candidatus Regiella insecticola]GFN47168.1 transglycosylase SLT domain-containing protein [Candidatus Regiella insecticola]GFN47449.1 transglycosylase SLT domain-containing protein [Candidatus Regiella insecticola]